MTSGDSTLRVEDVQITMVCPDGTQFYIGRPEYKHANPIVDAIRGRFERWRFERNRQRFNAFVARHIQVRADMRTIT